MKHCLLYLFCLLTSASYIYSAENPNILLICVDDLRPELGCYGVDYIKSPHIDSLAAKGRLFTQHFVNAPTCGASRYTLLTGRYKVGGGNGALFSRAKSVLKQKDHPASLPAWFREHGYTTVSVGKVSHHPGGRGGKDWDDSESLEMPNSWDRHLLPAGAWQHPRGWMHGLANGEIRDNASNMDVIQALEGPDSIYPDGISTDAAVEQLDQLAGDDKPFFLALGILRPHLPFGAPAKYLKLYEDVDLPPIANHKKPQGATTWHKSGEFRKYNSWNKNPDTDPAFATNVRKHYAACVSYADAQVGRILDKLDEAGLTDNTIVVLWGDHGWHLGEHMVWGKHTLFEKSLHAPLIVSYPGITNPGKTNASVVETVDLFATLSDLAGLPIPDYLDGRSMTPLLKDPSKIDHRHAIAYKSKSIATIRSNTHRLITHPKGITELYDHTTDPGETKNISSENQAIVAELKFILEGRLKDR